MENNKQPDSLIPEKTTKAYRVIVILYLLGAFAIFFTIMLVTGYDSEYLDDPAQIENFDFSSRLALLSPTVFDRHSDVFYSPDDFAAGGYTQASEPEESHTPFARYRLILNLEEGAVYGLSGHSATHAMTLWVDGAVIYTSGIPGRGLDYMTGGTTFFSIYFTAGQQTEIVLWRSGFVRADGGRLMPLYLGEQQLAANMNNLNHLRTGATVGITIMAALMFFGVFALFKERKHFMWFALLCVMIAIRTTASVYMTILTMFPDMGWSTRLIIADVATSGFIAFSILYIDSVFGNKLNRKVVWTAVFYEITYTVFRLLTPPIVFTQVTDLANGIALLLAGLVLANAVYVTIKRPNNFHVHPEHVLVLCAIAVNILFAAAEVVLVIPGRLFFQVSMMQIGVLVFVFVNAIALAINFQRMDVELANQRKSNRETEETNKLLAQLNRLKSNFLADISHEMKTPLGIMAGYAELTEWQVEDGETGEDSKRRLRFISEECQRLAGLAERLLNVAAARDMAESGVQVAVHDIVSRIFALSEPILSANGNRLTTHVVQGCPPLKANPDLIIEVFLNLLGNANRHSSNDIIELRVESGELRVEDLVPGMVVFTLKDNGTGISPDLLGKVFQRGVSGDGSYGLGLSICKDAVEAHGGEIIIESGGLKNKDGEVVQSSGFVDGTVVTFTLPVYDKEEGAQE